MKPIRLGEINNPYKKRKVGKVIAKFIPLVLITAVLVALGLFIFAFFSGSKVFDYIFSANSLKSSDGRVNVLLLGIAGGTHDGANLTDTIVVASYNLSTNTVYVISIPRDLWLPSLKSKANAAYEIGLDQGNGLGFAKTIIGNVLGLPIDYALRLDFNGFIKALDIVGGLDIDVENSFDDYNYPITGKEDDLCGYQEKEIDVSSDDAKNLNIPPGKTKVFVSPDGKIATDAAQEDKGALYFICRYEHISFTKGITHMNGETALKFVRSRHGTNGEASDFARSKRQQKVLEAFRKKILSFETFSNPQKLQALFDAFGKSIDTDISVKEALEFYKLIAKSSNTKNLVLDNSQRAGLINGRTSLLYNPNSQDYGGAYVLVSQDDDFSTIHDYLNKVLSGNIDEASSSARSGNN